MPIQTICNGGAWRIACVVLWLIGPAVPGSADSFHYAFVPGDEITYEVVREDRARNATAAFKLRIWCIDSPAPDSFSLLLTLETNEPRPAMLAGFPLTVSHRGKIDIPVEAADSAAAIDWVLSVLPALPPSELDQTWTGPADVFGHRWRGERLPRELMRGNQPGLGLSREDTSGAQGCAGESLRGKCWLDESQGLVSKALFQYDQPITRDRREITMTLSRRDRHKPRWAGEQAVELVAFLRAARLQQSAVDSLTRPAQPNERGDFEPVAARVARLWEEFEQRAAARQSPLMRLAANQRTAFTQRADLLRERARLSGDWLGRAAAGWTLQTPSGQTVQSESLRTRPALECFWRSDSLDSLRIFETLRELAAGVPDSKLAIVCLCLDSDPGQVTRVAQTCGRDLLHVHAGPPVLGLQPAEVPILRMLDRAGKIRYVHFGWRPGLTLELKRAFEDISGKP